MFGSETLSYKLSMISLLSSVITARVSDLIFLTSLQPVFI